MAASPSQQTLLLIHGFCEDKTLWDPIIPQLNFKGDILAINLPGFGNTPLLSQNFSLEEIATQLHTELVKKGVKNCICIGHSLGGYITLALKKSFPDFTEKIGLLHSTAYSDTPEKVEGRNKLIEFLDKNPANKFLSTFASTLFCETNREKLSDKIKKVVHMSDGLEGSTVQAYAKAMRDRKNNIDVLTNEKAPLFIAGKCDNSVPEKISKKQIGLIKDSTNCYVLENVAHMGMYEAPNLVIKAINAFINE